MLSIQKNSARFGFGVLATLICLGFINPAAAKDPATPKDMMPALSSTTEYKLSPNESTHPILRIAPDKTEMVKLDDDANSIIIGNPAHMNILMDNPRLLLIAARAPGATYFTVLNKDGKVIMSRHVIVTGPKEKYVRIRRSCINGGAGCADTSVYYCPDMCHEVRLLAGQENNNGQPGESVPSGTDSSGSTNEESTDIPEETVPADSGDADTGSSSEPDSSTIE